MISNQDGSYSFLSKANGRFVSVDNNGDNTLIANKDINRDTESFILIPNPDGSFTIEAKANWKFLCADNGGKNALTANRASTSLWETFELSYNPFANLNTNVYTQIQFWQSNPVISNMLKQLPYLYFNSDKTTNPYTIFVNENIKYQQVDGFGASLTDSSAWLLKYKLSAQKRTQLINELFSLSGIGISLLRQPIGSSDFSWEKWSFNDSPNNQDDFNLNSFALWREDDYIRPMFDLAIKASNDRMTLFASPWSKFHFYLTLIFS